MWRSPWLRILKEEEPQWRFVQRVDEIRKPFTGMLVTGLDLVIRNRRFEQVSTLDFIMAVDRSGVVAVTEIPVGSRSAPFAVTDIGQKIRKESLDFPVEVGVWKNGEIAPLSRRVPPTLFWLKLVQVAPDCHVQNVRVSRWHGRTLVLQATRTIPADQPLYMWFGEDLLINELGIPPYLSPGNIRGGNSYVCGKCRKEFEAPNYLKVHLATDCATNSLDGLWSRLENTLERSNPFLSLNIMTAALPAPEMLRSAPCYISSALVRPEVTLPTMGLRSLPSSDLGRLRGDRSEEQAHLESLVSNMGKAKNGHVCLYCGKLYSRKYGLKIHIRTHTGYKPLQCRICNRPFGDPSNLNKHVRLHSDGNTPYRCDYCGKILVRRRDLDRHIRSRHSTAATSHSHQRSATVTSPQ